MKRYKLLFCALAALAMTSVAALLLNASIWGLILCVPGFPLVFLFTYLTHSDSAFALPIATFVGYTVLFLVAVFLTTWSPSYQRWVKLIALPTFVVAILASIPTLDPLYPEGMTRLRRREAGLMYELPEGKSLADSKELLATKGITFREQSEGANVELLSRDNLIVRASAGDTVLFNHLSPSDVPAKGDAWQFPCRYDLQVILIFGADHRLKQRYIGHSRLCP